MVNQISFKTALLFFLLIFGTLLAAQDSKTMSYDSLVGSPSGQIQDISWIAGTWTGEAFGSATEEVWTQPSGVSMMGMFKLYNEDEIIFYELMTISQIGETLLMQLKHFNSDLTGWEEKNETIDFKLVEIRDDMVYFDGLTFERISEHAINVYVVIEDKNGNTREEKFAYKKQSIK